jgi:hypothetical protein
MVAAMNRSDRILRSVVSGSKTQSEQYWLVAFISSIN